MDFYIHLNNILINFKGVDNVEFLVILASKINEPYYEYEYRIKINTINDLEELYDEHGKDELIVNFEDREIIIYDAYIE